MCLLIRVLLVPNKVGPTPSKQIQPPSSSTVAAAEEEAMKRNTDCVYFLASPLTRKKIMLTANLVVHRKNDGLLFGRSLQDLKSCVLFRPDDQVGDPSQD
ncbi:hypothetical protein BC332_01513 [Capsicum chinense]|nr:hypothetical protein BC332_01513 [Capsicum chinense]